MSRGVTVVLGIGAVCGKNFMAAWNESDRLFSAEFFLPSQAAPTTRRKGHNIATMLSPHTAPIHAQHNCHALRHHNEWSTRSKWCDGDRRPGFRELLLLCVV
ncbi:unnamed protein product, partial [Ectocarpus fasciculatus]